LADHNININIKDLSKASAAGPKPAGREAKVQMDPASLQKLNRVFKDAVSKSFNVQKLSDSIANTIAKKIGSMAPKGGGGEITKADLGRTVNKISNDLAKKISQSLVNALSKPAATTAPGRSDKRIVDALSNVDKHIKGSIDGLSAQLQKQFGKQLGPENAKTIANAVSGAVEKSIPKSLGKATQDLSRAVSSIQSIMREISGIAMSLRKMRQSGGGIDITEIKPIISNLKNLTTEFKKLPTEIRQARESAKSIAKEEKELYTNFSKALTDLRKSARERVTRATTRAKEDPQKFARIIAKELSKAISAVPAMRGTKIEKALAGLDKKIETVGDITGAVKGLEKEIRNQVQSGKVSAEGAKSLVKAVDALNTNLRGLPTAMGGGESDKVLRRLEKFTERTGTLLKTVKVVLDEKEISKQIESAVKAAQPKIEIDASLKKGNLEKELTKLFNDISKKVKTLGFEPEMDVAAQLEKFKKSLVGGKAGEIRGAIFDLKKMPELKEFSDALQKAAESVAYLDSLKEAGSAAKVFTSEIGKATKTLAAIKGAPARMQMGPIRTARAALKTYEKYEYPAEIIPPTGKLELPPGKEKLMRGEVAKKAVEENVKSLAKSLESLQRFMVERLEKELTESGRGWGIVRESSEQAMDKYFKIATGGMTGNIKQAGKQWAIQIADISRMGKTLGSVFDPTKMVEAYKETLVERTVAKTKPTSFSQKIAKWIKLTAEENIKSMEELTDVQKEAFIKLKKESKGPEVAAEMEDAVKSLLATEKEIERVFKRTSATVEAERIMTEGILEKDKSKKRVYEEPPVLRTLAIPAAKLTGTGAAAFETAAGSMRALPKFAAFKTGFERIYEILLQAKRLRPGETFGGRIREIGAKPTGAPLIAAEKLSREMIKELSTVEEKRSLILEQYQRAAVPRGLELEKAGVGTIQQLEKQVEDAIGTFRKLPEAERNIDTFMDAMDKVGISAYDVVKSLDELRFENVYDIFQRILAKPIKGVAEAPVWGKPMRQFEETIRQMQQLLPIIEPGRPRRGPHMEAVAQLMTRTSPVYERSELRMSEQKDLIKDLNLRLGEMVSEAKTLREKEGEGVAKRLAQLKIPEAIKEMSTLGVPEALAGRVQELRPGKAVGMEKLQDLGATTLKMYTENLRELAPFGSQFQNWGRNITNVSNAMSSASDETIAALNKFGAAVEGTGTEFPTLRTEREREFISGGRFGKQGYGFNVLAELRTTAGTFEDQVLISGKIADALTSITKTLIRPGVAGRLKEFRETTAAGVTEIDPKLLRDVSKSVSDVSDKIQDVLGMPEKYKGRADKALIDSVSKAITVVRGREVEVQAAKLAEVFLNYFGRKITTRYGQKGVGVTPAPTNIREVLQYYGGKETKVLPKAERTRAGLGVAVMPKTMGQLASEILEKEAEKLETAGMAPAQIKRLSTSLVNSGNRFMLDMFKQAGVLAEDEIKVEKTLFTNLREALKKLDIDLASDIKGIGELKETYKERVGKPVFEERPIDVRISAAGVAKRGLQTEVLESVMANVMGLRPETKRPATMKTALKPEMYEKMLAGKGTLEPGMLSKYAKALGFEPAMAGKREDVYRQLVDEFTKTFGEGKEEIAKRAAELEALSNFYVEVIDELSRGKGAPRKGLVGPKFAQIVEEPTLHADWTKTEIEKGIRGEKLNLPAFGAYASIFGEQSEFMKELKKSMTVDSREAWEYLKALQVVNKQGDEFRKLLMKPLKTVDLLNIEDFTEATGTLEDFKGTILDIQKFPGPFKTKIPATEKGKAGAYEELYVPGPLARGTYEESLIAGERAPKLVARRLAHLISMAKKVEQERTGFAEIEKEIGTVESVLAKAEDPTEIDVLNDKLVALNKQLEGLYADPKNVGVIKTKIVKTVGNMVKEVNKLATAKTGEPEIVDIISTLMGALSETVGPGPGLRTRGVGAELPEITHAQKFMEEQLRIKESPFEAYAATAGRLSDMLISVSEKSKLYLANLEETLGDIERGQTTKRVETFAKGRGLAVGAPEVEKTLRTFIKTHQDRMKSVSVLERSTAGGGLATLAANLGVTIEKADSDYEKALAALARAKIDYYNTLAETALGKKGAIAEVLFSRTIPAIMGKAVAATVDKTDDLQRFTEDLGNIYAQFEDLGKEFKLEELAEVSEKILKLREEHAKNVEQYKKLGLPVLKQYELGVPPEMAKKIPLKYTPKYRMKGKGIEEIPEAMQKEVQATLFDILEEAETLTKGGFVGAPGGPKPPSRGELQEYVEKQLVPYIESVRYPFTGISSVQPYKAKLMRGETAKTALAVPGMPEMDLAEFDKLLEKVKEIKKAFEDAREGLQDIPGDIEKRKSLTEVIDELNKAISRVLPKYAAHEQKLDFDGDAIEIHSAATREAREEIKKHFESLGDDIDSTRAVFRDFFTYGARQIPTGKYPLAEMTQAFEKKFPAEKGFEFLKKPHLTKEEQYLKPAEALKILAERPGAAAPADVLKDIVQQMVRAPEEQKQALEAIDMSVNKEADALVRAVESLGGNIEKLVKEGIKTRSFEEKYKDAIEAQLYKIHTGPETEALYRLVRLVEMNVGFGGGQIRPEAPSRAIGAFKERWPRGAALGGKPEFEFQTMINELLRFGIQKGMDVKHAGEFPVAGEVVRELSKGEKAAEKLFDRITDKNEEAFKDLREFAEQNEEAVRRRLGRLSTREVRAEATKLRKGRGMGAEDIGEISRTKVVKEIIDMAGFKGFLIELARQIREAAGTKPGEEADIRGAVIAKRQPLYMKRVWRADPAQELGKFKGDIPTPEFEFGGMGKGRRKAYIRKYKETQATAMNLAKELKTATETMGGGAYAEMVSSSIENIYEEQRQINEKLLSKLQEPAGFAANIPETSLVERVLTGADVSNITKALIGDPREVAPEFMKKMKDQVEEYSKLAGVSLLTKAEKFEIKQQSLEEFGKKVAGVLGVQGVPPEEIERYSFAWVEKAKAIAQMDKIIEALKSKRYEASIVRTLLPSPEALEKVAKEQIRTAPKPLMPTAEEREEMVKRYMPRAAARGETMAATKGAAARALLPRGAKDCVPITNCGKPLEVYVVGADADVLVSDVGQEKALTSALKQQMKETGPATALEKQAEALRSMAEQVTGKLNTLVGATYETIYRASGLKGAGMYKQREKVFKPAGIDVEELKRSQMQSVMEQMLGLGETTPVLEASALLGTALHSKIEKELKKKYGEKVEFEKFVKYEDEILGTIGGHIDAALKDASGNIEKIIDVKTIGESVLKDIGSGVIDLDEAINKATNTYTKYKLEETASQINLYLAAVAKETGRKPEEMVGEARLYSRLAPEKEPAVVRVKFDPTRLQRDLEAVRKSRELIQKYIIEENPLELADIEYRKIVDTLKAKLAGKKPEFAPVASLKEMEEASKNIQEMTDKQITEFVRSATDYYLKIAGKKAATMPAKGAFTGRPFEAREKVRIEKQIREAAKSKMDIGGFEKAAEIAPTGDLESVFKALTALHTQAKNYQSMINKLDFETEFKGLNKAIQEVLADIKEKGRAGGAGGKLVDIMKDLQEEGAIGQAESSKVWKMYRMAVGDFYLREAAAAKKAMEDAGDDWVAANEAYAKFSGSIERFQEFIIESLPKRTGIYTAGQQYVSPELARGAGVYMEPKEIAKKAGGALGEDEQLRQLFKMLVETEKAPIFKARDVVSSLTNINDEMVSLLNNADLVKRKGEEFKDAWDFSPLTEGATRLKTALQSYLRFNVRDDFTATQRKNLQDVLGYLKQVEKGFSKFGGAATGKWGETGAVKVMPWLDPKTQRALHMRNIASTREYFKKAQAAGGPQVGERFTYLMKVLDQTGNVVKNAAVDFNKYGEFVNRAGEASSAFAEKQRDLMLYTQGANRTFKAALRRVTMWGAAATVVYGGMSQLKSMIGTIADIEMGITQLRMVMSPLETDFGMMGKAAIGFAKQFGTPMKDVLQGMRIFAQQGLNMADVIDRTRTATLAANVTTLNAKDATQAITAASKVFRQEGESTLKFIDAWSEVEAKHAITSEDLALALRKAASAGKNAGFTFDELNGIIASIGAVTRQTGREVGTSLRFIFRRLASEKGPKELAKIGIPVMTETGELRRGFEILSDLAMAWKDLTSAQKMNISQSIGGTRQYNQVLVLMDNWEEAQLALKDSINSTGSAQRRNQEIMKTYAKQLQQTKAAAVELQMAFGKVYLPIAKFGLGAMKFFLESITAIPTTVKAAAVGLALLVTYISKGDKLITSLSQSLGKGGQFISEFFSSFEKGMKITGFELFGAGKGMGVEGLKRVTEGKSLKDFHSALGKTAFILTGVGQSYNRFIGDVVKGSGAAAEAAGETLEKIGSKISLFNKATLEASGLGYKGIMDILQKQGLKGVLKAAPKLIGSVAAIGTEVAGQSAKVAGKAIDSLGEVIGKGGQKILEDFASTNAGLVKSLVPLGVTVAALIPSFKALYDYYGRLSKSAQDYEKSSYGIKRAGESELSTMRELIKDYEMMENKLMDVGKAAQPEVKARRIEYETYEAPILTLSKLQKQATQTANDLAKTNINLIRGYDELGNAVLKNVGSFKAYLKELERFKVKELAATDVDVLEKYVYDLTQIEGPEKWKTELKRFVEEAPVIGKLIGKQIKVSPAKALDEVTKRLNSLIALKNKYPIATAFDKDIKEYQTRLDIVRKGFNETYKDFKRVLSDIRTEGLEPGEIAGVFAAPELRKGFELIAEIEPRFKFVPSKEIEIPDPYWRDLMRTMKVKTGVKWQDVLGAEVMKRAFPETAPVLDATQILTKARLETKGLTPMKGKEVALKVGKNYIVTFYDEIIKQYSVAGNQAVLKLRETADGVLEWMVTYFNTKTLDVQERPLTEDMRKLISNVFPLQAMQEELEERIDVFSEFTAGAAAGLRGVSAKDFRRDFNLGERFFSEIPTTTLLQGPQGFAPGKGFMAESPFQKDWAKTMKEFYLEPMKEYRKQVEKLEKLQIEGLQEAGGVDLAKELYVGLKDLQDVLKNNQVVLQYRAVFVDFTKAMEESSRALKENIAIEKTRIELQTQYTGILKGLPEGLENFNLGARQFTDLTAEQRVLLRGGGNRQRAVELRMLNVRRSAMIGQVEAVDKALIALQNIREVAEAFGAVASPERARELVRPVAEGATPGEAMLLLEGRKTTENTADTVDRLDRMLERMGDDEATERYLGSISDYLGVGVGWSQKTVNAMERIARIREKASDAGNQDLVMQTDKMLDQLSLQLVRQEGLKKAMQEVDDNFTLFGKRFTSREFVQRVFGATGLDMKTFTEEMKKAAPEIPEEYDWKKFEKLGRKAFDESSKVKELTKLQKADEKTQLIQSKTLSKASIALATFEYFNKGHSSKVIDNLQGQQDSLKSRMKQAEAEGKDTFSMSKEMHAVNQALKKERERLDLHKMAQSIGAISAGTIELSRAMGLTEGQIKALGLGAASTYAAMKLASLVTGTSLPSAAKKFEESLVKYGKEIVVEGKAPDIFDKAKLKLAGRDLVGSFKDSLKKTTGVTQEEFEKAAKKQVDVEQRAGDIRAKAQASTETNRLRQVAMTYMAMTLDGYVAARKEEETKLNTLNAKAEKQSDVFIKALERYIDPAEKVLEDRLKTMQTEVERTGKAVKPEQSMKSMLLDQEEGFDVITKNLKDFRKKFVSEVDELNKEAGKAADKLALEKVAEALRMEIEKLELSLANQAKKFDLERMFGGTALMAGPLRGFPGEPTIAPAWEEMSGAQRLFLTGADEFKTKMEEFAYFQQTIGTRVSAISGLEDQVAAIEQNIEAHKKLGLDTSELTYKYDKLTKYIDRQKDALSAAGKEWETFANKLKVAMKFEDVIKGIEEAQRRLTVEQRLALMPEVREFAREEAMLPGGGGPLAPIMVTPELERMARAVGMVTKNFETTAMEAERVRLMYQAQTASGEELVRINRQIADLPLLQARRIGATEQQRENELIRQQGHQLNETLSALENYLTTPGLEGEQVDAIRNLQKTIRGIMAGFYERVTPGELISELATKGIQPGMREFKEAAMKISEAQMRGQGKIFRGILPFEQRGIKEALVKIRESLGADALEGQAKLLKNMSFDPMQKELEKQTNLLEKMATKGEQGSLSKAWKFIRNPAGAQVGGSISGPGGPKEDKVPIMASPGEYVIRQAAARRIGYNALEYMNEKGMLPSMQNGGFIERRRPARKLPGVLDEEPRMRGIKTPKKLEEKMLERIPSNIRRILETIIGMEAPVMGGPKDPLSFANGGMVERLKEWWEAIKSGETAKLVLPKTGPLGMGTLGESVREIGKQQKEKERQLKEMGLFQAGGMVKMPVLDPKMMTPSAREFYETMKDAGMPYKEIAREFEGLKEPWIDPTMAFSGGFGGMLGKGLTKAAIAGLASAAGDYPLGLATEKIGEKVPGAALPFNILTGMLTGKMAAKTKGATFIENLLKSQRGAVGKDIGYARSLLQGATFNLGEQRYLHASAGAILESPSSEKILSKIPYGSKVLDLGGAQAIVLETPQGKVIRIGDLSPERPKIPGMLQAESRDVFGDLQMETMPKIKTEGITRDDVHKVNSILKSSGYEIRDFHTGNVGRIEETGERVLLDPGAWKKIGKPEAVGGFGKAVEQQKFDPEEAGAMLAKYLGGYAGGGFVQKALIKLGLRATEKFGKGEKKTPEGVIGGPINPLLRMIEKAKEKIKSKVEPTSRLLFGVRKEEEEMMKELFPGEPIRAQGYQFGGMIPFIEPDEMPGIATAREAQQRVRALTKDTAKEPPELKGETRKTASISALGKPVIETPKIDVTKAPIAEYKRKVHYAGLNLGEMAASDPRFGELGQSVQRLILMRSTLDKVIKQIEDKDSVVNNLTFDKDVKSDYEKTTKPQLGTYKRYQEKLNDMLYRIEEGERAYDPSVRKEYATLLRETSLKAKPFASFGAIRRMMEAESTHLTRVQPFAPKTFGKVLEPFQLLKEAGFAVGEHPLEGIGLGKGIVMKPGQLKMEKELAEIFGGGKPRTLRPDVGTGYFAKEQEKFKDFSMFFGKPGTADYTSSDFWQKLFSDLMMPKTKIPSYQTGIKNVPENQLAFLHKDETVLPAGSSENMDKFLDKLERVLGDAELKIEDKILKIEDKILEVDVPDSIPIEVPEIAVDIPDSIKVDAPDSIPVEIPEITVDIPDTISLDAGDAIGRLERAIEGALSAGVPGAVGAEKVDTLEQLVQDVHDKILDVKGKHDDDIEIVNQKREAGEALAQRNLEIRLAALEAVLTREINLAKSESTDSNSEIMRTRQHLETLIEEAKRIAVEAKNLGGM